jgi:hypothetical protein
MVLSDQWHKLLAIVLLHQGLTELEITPSMVQDFADTYPNGAVVADARHGEFILRLVSAEEGARLARQEGGLPA